MEKNIVVPEFMLKAAYDAQLPADNPSYTWEESAVHTREFYQRILGASLLALSKNPIVPTLSQLSSVESAAIHEPINSTRWLSDVLAEWQRCCFLAHNEYREIQLTKGQVALVDPDDFERLNSFEWYARESGNTFYAERHVQLENGLRGVSSMHREVIGAQPGEFVDHRDRNGLHNWKDNLRRCTDTQNKQNVIHSDKVTSKYKGVCLNSAKEKYMARIGYDGTMHHIGYFEAEEDAARAYDREARIHHGEFAYLNFPEDIRMFLASELEENFDDLIISVLDVTPITTYRGHIEARATLLAVAEEAFRRGQKVGSK